MRFLQNLNVYPTYLAYISEMTQHIDSYEALYDFMLGHSTRGHILKPVLDRDEEARLFFFRDERSQRLWAREHGMPDNTSLEEIALAQIEEHRTEVFYNLHSTGVSKEFTSRLPACVRLNMAWHASSFIGDFAKAHDLIVSNFPRMNQEYERLGCRSEYFFPSHDPMADELIDENQPRRTGVLFIGGYSRHHRRRARLLRRLAEKHDALELRLHLDKSRYSWLAQSPLGWVGPLRRVRWPKAVRRVAQGPIFGRDMLNATANARIVINMAIDMAEEERGNKRCFEALSCGALLLSDSGAYPAGFEHGKTMVCYNRVDEAIEKALFYLENEDLRMPIAQAGRDLVRTRYSKAVQWKIFQEICEKHAS